MTDYQIEAYKGSEKYIFVSYAHKDSDQVFPILKSLKIRGYRIWYDEGITPGSEWSENIAMHLNNSAMVIAFVTPNFMSSMNCRREINFALSKQKPLLSVVLEPTQMPLGMEMQLSAQQNIIRNHFTSEEKFIEKICAFPKMSRCKLQLESPKTMEELVSNSPPSQLTDSFDIRYHAEIAETLRQDHVKSRVSYYGGIVASVTSCVGAVILIGVTVLLFANYHQENLASFTSVGQFPAWFANMLPRVWQELPPITSPDFQNLENLPAIAWLIGLGWLLKSIGHTFKRHAAVDKMVGIAAVLRYAAIAGHIALCACVEDAVQQGAPQWEAWLPYYLPVENLVVFAAMIVGGFVIGWSINWIVRKVLSAVFRTAL